MTAPFRWGLLGAGAVAHNFARSVALLPDQEVAAVGSRNLARAQNLQNNIGAETAYADYGALVNDASLDAVYIATPAALHHDHVALALQAGMPVLCEKPFTVTADEARALATLARETGVFCMEAMWMRFIPAIRALKARIASGEVGEARLLQAELGFPMPFDPDGRLYNKELGGGALLDLGVYPLSLAWFLFGKPVAGQMLIRPASTGVDAQAVINLRFASGTLASLSCSFDQRLRNAAMVTGTHGTLETDTPLYAPEQLTLTRTPPPSPAASGSGLASDGGGSWMSRLSQTHPSLIRLRRRFAPMLRQVLRRERTVQSYPVPGYGYQFEAVEVARCVRAGLTDSPHMPLSETVEILDVLDRLRRDGTFFD